MNDPTENWCEDLNAKCRVVPSIRKMGYVDFLSQHVHAFLSHLALGWPKALDHPNLVFFLN